MRKYESGASTQALPPDSKAPATNGELFRRALQYASVGMCLLTVTGDIIESNTALRDLLVLDGQPTQTLWDRLHADDASACRDALASLVRRDVEHVRLRERFQLPDGSIIWADLAASSVPDMKGLPLCVICSVTDVTDEITTMQELDRYARYDDLTGLLNRRQALRILDGLVSRATTAGSNLGIIFCDLDRFKNVNDEFGHAVGDVVIRIIAERVRRTVRAADLVARIGGDELLVLLPDVGTLEQVVEIAEKVRVGAAEPIHMDGLTLQLSVSLGATLAIAGEDADTLLHRADTAMYRAKSNGRNMVCVFDDEPLHW